MCTNIQKSVESANKRVKMLCFLLLFSLSFANAVADTRLLFSRSCGFRLPTRWYEGGGCVLVCCYSDCFGVSFKLFWWAV